MLAAGFHVFVNLLPTLGPVKCPEPSQKASVSVLIGSVDPLSAGRSHVPLAEVCCWTAFQPHGCRVKTFVVTDVGLGGRSKCKPARD